MNNFKPLFVTAAVILMNGIDIILRTQIDLCKLKPEKNPSTDGWGGGHQVSPPAEKILAIHGFWEKES